MPYSPPYSGGKKGGVGRRHNSPRSCIPSGAGMGALCWVLSRSQFRQLRLLPSKLVFLPSAGLKAAGAGCLPSQPGVPEGQGAAGLSADIYTS